MQGERRQRPIEVFSSALLIACARRRVYHRFMVRKCASLAFALVLIAALGFGTAHAKPLKVPCTSNSFSALCEPASRVFKVAGESKSALPVESTFAAENAEVPAGAVRLSRLEAVARAIPSLAHMSEKSPTR
jgi:hypothetical protein